MAILFHLRHPIRKRTKPDSINAGLFAEIHVVAKAHHHRIFAIQQVVANFMWGHQWSSCRQRLENVMPINRRPLHDREQRAQGGCAARGINRVETGGHCLIRRKHFQIIVSSRSIGFCHEYQKKGGIGSHARKCYTRGWRRILQVDDNVIGTIQRLPFVPIGPAF